MAIVHEGDQRLSRRAYLAVAGATALGLAGCQGSGETQPTAMSRQSTTAPTATVTTDAETPAETRAGTPDGDEASAAERTLADLAFDGELFDTHVHWGQAESKGARDLTIDALTARQAEHDVGAAVLFTSMDFLVDDYESTVQTLSRDAVDYLPFMTPGTMSQFSADGLGSLYRGHEEILHGVGEIVYYGGPMRGKSFDADPLPEILEFAGKHDLVLMLHPTRLQADEIGPVLSKHPDTTVLFHGYQLVRAGDTVDVLLQNHDNLYWTYDVTEMADGLFTEASGKADFIDRFDANRSRFLDRAVSRLPQLLDVAPDRVMWGTDVVSDWNVDPEVYRRGIELTWDVIEALPPAHRDSYAHENAVSLFGG